MYSVCRPRQVCPRRSPNVEKRVHQRLECYRGLLLRRCSALRKLVRGWIRASFISSPCTKTPTLSNRSPHKPREVSCACRAGLGGLRPEKFKYGSQFAANPSPLTFVYASSQQKYVYKQRRIEPMLRTHLSPLRRDLAAPSWSSTQCLSMSRSSEPSKTCVESDSLSTMVCWKSVCRRLKLYF